MSAEERARLTVAVERLRLAILARKDRQCEWCGRSNHGVKYDRGTRMHLCNACWFGTRPGAGATEGGPR